MFRIPCVWVNTPLIVLKSKVTIWKRFVFGRFFQEGDFSCIESRQFITRRIYLLAEKKVKPSEVKRPSGD